MRNKNRCFLHQFGALFLREAFEILPKSLIHCVIAGLTRNLILAPSDVTRYVSTVDSNAEPLTLVMTDAED